MRRVTAPSGGALSLEEKRGSFASCGFRSTWQRSLSDDWGTPEPGAWARASARLISESTSSPITCFSCLWRFCFRDFKYCESFYKVGWFLESHGTTTSPLKQRVCEVPAGRIKAMKTTPPCQERPQPQPTKPELCTPLTAPPLRSINISLFLGWSACSTLQETN